MFAGPNGDRTGQAYVVFGKASGFNAAFELSTLDGTNGFMINGVDLIGFAGSAVSSAGDVNGDGYDDVIVGANWADANGKPNVGKSYVLFGRKDGFVAAFELSSLDGTNGFAVIGVDQGDRSGFAVSSAGDLNGTVSMISSSGQPMGGRALYQVASGPESPTCSLARRVDFLRHSTSARSMARTGL